MNALGANQREHSVRLAAVETKVDSLETNVDSLGTNVDDTNARVRSLEGGQSDIKDLLIRALGR